jgi:hypothetical protein
MRAGGSGRSIGVLSEAQLHGQQRETAAQATDRHYAKCSHMSADAVFEYLVASPPDLLGHRTLTAGRHSSSSPAAAAAGGHRAGADVDPADRTPPQPRVRSRCTRVNGGRSHHKSSPRRTVSRTAIVATNNTPANTAPGALPPSTEATSDIRKPTTATDHARMPACLLCIPWFPCQPRTCSGRESRPVYSSVAHCRQPRYCNSAFEARNDARRLRQLPLMSREVHVLTAAKGAAGGREALSGLTRPSLAASQ